jgi:hypothetical protein
VVSPLVPLSVPPPTALMLTDLAQDITPVVTAPLITVDATGPGSDSGTGGDGAFDPCVFAARL